MQCTQQKWEILKSLVGCGIHMPAQWQKAERKQHRTVAKQNEL